MRTPSANTFKIVAYSGCGTICADEKHACASWLLNLFPIPSACRGLWIDTLSVSLFPNNKPLLYSILGYCGTLLYANKYMYTHTHTVDLQEDLWKSFCSYPSVSETTWRSLEAMAAWNSMECLRLPKDPSVWIFLVLHHQGFNLDPTLVIRTWHLEIWWRRQSLFMVRKAGGRFLCL